MKPWIRSMALVAALLFIALPSQAPAADKAQGCGLEVMRTAVNVAAEGLGGTLALIADQEKRLVELRAFVDKVRFLADRTGYFYVYTMECVNVAHATQPDLVGKDLRDYRDPAGKYVIRELSAAAAKGGGFVDYLWQKPGEQGQHEKVGYAAPIPGTDWFIGSGIYKD